MELHDVWPLFGLEIVTPRLVLRPVSDADLPGLVQAALDGVHGPGPTPFGFPWTDADPSELPRNLAAYQWRLRSRFTVDDWVIPLAIHFEGRVIGAQDVAATDFAHRRTVSTGSWLTKSVHGRGIGTEMRAAVLLFAFDALGAEVAESGALTWNEASLTVSRKLGYELNGRTRVAPRPDELADEQRLRLEKSGFVRPDWAITVRGVEPALAQLGVDD